jgi:hypothetical protein
MPNKKIFVIWEIFHVIPSPRGTIAVPCEERLIIISKQDLNSYRTNSRQHSRFLESQIRLYIKKSPPAREPNLYYRT